MTDHKIQSWQLKQRQSLNLDVKIEFSKLRIREFYIYYKGQVYIAFSGGKDSTVLLHLIRSMYPDVPAVFIDTGLEFPEIRNFVKTFDNVTWLKPDMNYRRVIDKYGYPIISKNVSMAVSRYRNTTSEEQKHYRLYGRVVDGKKHTAGVIPKRYHYLVDAPFDISEQCCEVMKKKPAKKYHKETGRVPFIGTMASDSKMREQNYLSTGCNVYDSVIPKSQPLSIWTEDDIWEYIKKFDIPYSEIYDMGYDRTGCIFCMFGVHMEPKPNRFQRMSETHPKQYKYCMEKLGLREVLKFIRIDPNPSRTLESFEDD